MSRLFGGLSLFFISIFIISCGVESQNLDLNSSNISEFNNQNNFSLFGDKNTTSLESSNDLSRFPMLSGRAIDGYLQEAYVCIDSNLDDSCLEEPYQTNTDKLGYYELVLDDAILSDIASQKLPILIYGGTDSDSKRRYRGKLKAIVDRNLSTHNVTPLTSLAYSAYKGGLSIQESKSITAQRLQLHRDDIDSDFLEERNQNAQAAALSLQKSLELLSKTDNEIAQGYKKLGEELITFTSDANLSLVDLIATLDNSSSALEMITLVNNMSQAFTIEDINQSNALSLLNENLKVIKDIAENNNTELRESFNSLIQAVISNDIEGSIKSTYINKLLLSSLDISNVDTLISQLDYSTINLPSDATVTQIVDAINQSNPGFIKSTLVSVTEILKTSGLALSKSFLSDTLVTLLSSDKNLSTIFSPKAFLEFAVQDKSDLFLNVVTESQSLGKFFNEEPNNIVVTALNLSGLNLSNSTIQTLAKINLAAIGDQNSSSGLLNYALTLLPSSKEGNLSNEENNLTQLTFSGVLFDFVLDKISGDTTLQDFALQQAVVLASKQLNIEVSLDQAKAFLALYKDRENISLTNLSSYYELLKSFASAQTTTL